mmetsp:Transcript_48292/g.67076  ORF Transcript_48292/g.67076 Transcript_48292/m.67076 type:complete len:209 (-) Transcript_48292:31-657(-)
MSAHSRAHQQLGVTGVGKDDLLTLINKSVGGVLVLLLDFGGSQSSDEDRGTVPDDLHNLTGRKLTNFHLHISILVVSLPTVQSANNTHSVQSGNTDQTSIVNGRQQVELSSSDIVLTFVVGSVLLEPVVEGDLEVKMVTKVTRSGAGNEIVGSLRDEVALICLLIGSVIILRDNAEIALGSVSKRSSSDELAKKAGGGSKSHDYEIYT